MQINKISLVGLGAVGAMYAWRLSQHLGAKQVRIIVDQEREERYRREQVFLNGKAYPFNYCPVGSEVEPADLLLFATKNNTFVEAMEAATTHVSSSTIILSLLNGLDSEELIRERFPEAHLLYGFTTALDSTRSGNQITFSNEGTIFIGEPDNQITPQLSAVHSLFEQAQIKSMIAEDIQREMWSKFMVNVSINTVSAISGATYGGCATITELKSLIIALQREVIALAQAQGIKGLDDSYIDYYQRVFASLDPEGKTSMLQDVEAQRVSENRWFCQKASALGQKLAVPTPLCDILGDLMSAIDQLNSR